MKVYKSEFIGGWGGGCAIVAANSEEEALGIMFEQSEDYHFRGYDCEARGEYPNYDRVTPFEEIQGLNYEGTESKILFCDIYEE